VAGVSYIINQKESNDVKDYYKALIYDLKNGLAYRRPDPIYLRKNVMGEVLNEVGKFLKDEGTPYEQE